jgi:hypothetical protein
MLSSFLMGVCFLVLGHELLLFMTDRFAFVRLLFIISDIPLPKDNGYTHEILIGHTQVRVRSKWLSNIISLIGALFLT